MSTNDFTNEYKKKVDALQTLYRFKGNVETLEELNSKTNNNVGDTWNCKEDGNNYCWNKMEWVNIGTNIDLSNYATKGEVETLRTNIENAIQEVADTVVTEIATTTQDGLMSKEDKAKLDALKNIEAIKKAINGIVVFEGNSTEEITLSEDLSDADKIEIFYSANEKSDSVMIDNPVRKISKFKSTILE